MTEREHDDTLLDELLTSSETTPTPAPQEPRITRRLNESRPVFNERAEMQLLREANAAGTPTLAPTDAPAAPAAQPAASELSFGGEIKAVVQRHPLPAVLIVAGVAYALTRRRR